MITRERLLFACLLAVAGIGGIVVAAQPLIIVGLVALVAGGWWVVKHDAWQAFYAATLLLMAGVTTNLPEVVAVSSYGRFAALGLLMAVSWWTTRHIRPAYAGKLHKRMLGAIWALVIIAIVSTIWSPSKAETFLGAGLFAGFTFVLHLVTTRRWRDRSKIGKDLQVAFAVLTIVFVSSLATLLVGFTDNETYGGRFRGIFDNPNMLAQLAAPAIPLAWVVFKSKRGWLPILFIAPPVAVLLLTQSRTALLAALVGVAFMIVRSGVGGILKASFIIFMGLIYVIYNGAGFLADAFSRFGQMEGGDVLNTRGTGWELAMLVFRENIFGVGWQAGPVVFGDLVSRGLTNASLSVHNSFFQTLLELGIFAVAPLLIIILTWATIAMQSPMGTYCRGLAGVMVTGIIIQLAESSIFGVGQAYPYVFWFAVFGAITLTEDQRRMTLEKYRMRKKFPAGRSALEAERLVKIRTERQLARDSIQRQ